MPSSFAPGRQPGAVLAERHQREVVTVEVVAEVEVTREARAGEEALLPRAVRALRADEPVDATLHGMARRAIGGERAEGGPRGLRRRGGGRDGERLVGVGSSRP